MGLCINRSKFGDVIVRAQDYGWKRNDFVIQTIENHAVSYSQMSSYQILHQKKIEEVRTTVALRQMR